MIAVPAFPGFMSTNCCELAPGVAGAENTKLPGVTEAIAGSDEVTVTVGLKPGRGSSQQDGVELDGFSGETSANRRCVGPFGGSVSVLLLKLEKTAADDTS